MSITTNRAPRRRGSRWARRRQSRQRRASTARSSASEHRGTARRLVARHRRQYRLRPDNGDTMHVRTRHDRFAGVAGVLAFAAVAGLAVGAIAIGRLAIRRMALERGSIKRLKIDELEVGRLRVRRMGERRSRLIPTRRGRRLHFSSAVAWLPAGRPARWVRLPRCIQGAGARRRVRVPDGISHLIGRSTSGRERPCAGCDENGFGLGPLRGREERLRERRPHRNIREEERGTTACPASSIASARRQR